MLEIPRKKPLFPFVEKTLRRLDELVDTVVKSGKYETLFSVVKEYSSDDDLAYSLITLLLTS